MHRFSILLFMFSNSLFCQLQINNSKVEKLCFDLHNQERDSTKPRKVNMDCKKAADFQVKYLVHNDIVSHQNKTAGYENPIDRFEKFMSEKISIKDQNNPKLLHNQLMYEYTGEIICWSSGYKFQNDSLLEFNIAKHILHQFINSPMHYHIMVSMTCCNFQEIGYFSTNIEVLEYNEVSNDCTLEIHCVAIFGSRYPFKDTYVYDPSTGKWID